MKRTYRTAQGKNIDLDSLILSNEKTIAMGNMNVNARGDELGPGGKVSAKRNQTMDDYYRLNTSSTSRAKNQLVRNQQAAQTTHGEHMNNKNLLTSEEVSSESVSEPVSRRQGLRGNLADAVAKQTVVEQPEIHVVPEKKGPSRI
jgi:hypothetical protein